MSAVAWLRRWIRSHERLRRAAGAIVASLSRLRTRRLTTRERWERAIPYESNFWADWLATKAFDDVAQYERRVDPSAVLDEALITDRFKDLPEGKVTILDVGAGPLTTVGKTYPGRQLQIVAIDPLAEAYDRTLAEAGVTPPVRTEAGEGERLLEAFEPSSFDIAYAANALDHSYDPVLVIRNMLEVVKPGGFVLLTHRQNEAESKGYLGLHQWNFENRHGRFFIWNQTSGNDVAELLGDSADVQCSEHDGYVECVIRKNPSDPGPHGDRAER
jgi:SAM-dependent methyltransferase